MMYKVDEVHPSVTAELWLWYPADTRVHMCDVSLTSLFKHLNESIGYSSIQ